MCYQYIIEGGNPAVQVNGIQTGKKKAEGLTSAYESKELIQNKNKVVYISRPFSAPQGHKVIENVGGAMRVAVALIKKGYTPVCPHTNYFVSMAAEEESIYISYEEWMRQCLSILKRCDAMLYLGYSEGCNRELRFALDHNIPVYLSIEELEKVMS